jgi:hypothetical protein
MTVQADQPISYAVVTPTFSGDFDRCALLVDSLKRIGGDHHHYLLVDRKDVALFRALEGDRTTIIESESIIDGWLRRAPGKKGYWISFRALPVRGWIIQQILKMSVTRALPHDAFVICDSDVAFVRPFSIADFDSPQGLELLDTPFEGGWGPRWTEVACEMLGLDAAQLPVRNHVGVMICWTRANILGLHARIEKTTGKPWQLAVARQLRFSEYMLYGAYVRGVLGYPASGHAPNAESRIKSSWSMDLDSDEALDEFFDTLDARHVGVMIHSKDYVDPARVRLRLERMWNRL